MAVVTFDYNYFIELFPQFVGNPSVAVVTDIFSLACEYIDNTDKSIFPYDPINGIMKRKLILYYLTCHLLTLRGWGETGQAGNLTNASQGSVSTGFNLPSIADGSSAAWWYNQTLCGQSAWRIIKSVVVANSARYYNVKHFHPYG